MEETGKEAIFLELDLASLASVKEAATAFLSKEEELHMLFNNACVRPLTHHLSTPQSFTTELCRALPMQGCNVAPA